MAVRATNAFEVAPANLADFIALIPEARAIIEKHGGTNLRVWQAAAAGPNVGRIGGEVEFADMAAYGAYFDAISADPDFIALQQKAASIGTLILSAVSVELPG